MRNLGLVTILAFLLISCGVTEKRFEQMSEQELFAYNTTVKLQDQVYCSESVGTASHIRKRVCLTYSEMAQGRVGTLNTPSSSSSISR